LSNFQLCILLISAGELSSMLRNKEEVNIHLIILVIFFDFISI